jgi:hypothetical protein
MVPHFLGISLNTADGNGTVCLKDATAASLYGTV